MEYSLGRVQSRKLLQFGWGYGYTTYNGHRWIYWAVPLIAVGIFVFITALVIFCVKRRRLARFQGMPPRPPPPPVVSPVPVTGYPDYSSQYNNDYATYNSVPASRPPPYASQPIYGTPEYKPGNIEMGYPPRM